MEAKSIKNHLKNDIQDSIPKFNPLWPENQTQDTSKTLPRRPHDAPRGPKTLQDVPKTAPGRLQDDPRTLPRRFKIFSRHPQDGSKLPKTPQNASKTPQDASKTPSRCLLFFISFSSGFLIDFGSIFHANLVQLGLQNPPKSMKNRCQEALLVEL